MYICILSKVYRAIHQKCSLVFSFLYLYSENWKVTNKITSEITVKTFVIKERKILLK